jgi:hypothetical protein
MDLEPIRVKHVRMAGDSLGNFQERAIEMLGDRMPVPSWPFAVLPAFSNLLQRSS